jgi:hypothetical protein
MELQIIDPAEYPEWDSVLLHSNDHSFFHSSAWARVLKESYKYKPFYFVFFEGDRLALLMPIMEVQSFLTGVRGVCLPFTDQCPAYKLKSELLPIAVSKAIDYARQARWRYIEWRDTGYFAHGASSWDMYYTHDIDLAKSEHELFSSLRDSNRRCIKKAVREGVSIQVTQTLDSLKSFYVLNCITRRRHGLPPQPFVFFKNVFDHVISRDLGIVVAARHSNKVIASSIFFHFGTSAIYKYGASDFVYQTLRPNNLVMWEAIKWYQQRGFMAMNLGRSDPRDQGLLQYKRAWGAKETTIHYYRYDVRKQMFLKDCKKGSSFLNILVARLPTFILRLAGRLLYRHIG